MSRDLGVSEGRLGLLVTGVALMVAVLRRPDRRGPGARFRPAALLGRALIGYAVCNAHHRDQRLATR